MGAAGAVSLRSGRSGEHAAYIAALAILLTGRRQRDRPEFEPQIGAGFRLTTDDRKFYMGITWRTGVEQVLFAFDVDDAAGPPVGLGVIRRQGEMVACYDTCRLWAPANDGRPLIVPAGAEDHGHFAFRPGARLRHSPSRPAGNLEAGFRRGGARLTTLANSAELRDVHREGHCHVISSNGGVLSTTKLKLAA